MIKGYGKRSTHNHEYGNLFGLNWSWFVPYPKIVQMQILVNAQSFGMVVSATSLDPVSFSDDQWKC